MKKGVLITAFLCVNQLGLCMQEQNDLATVAQPTINVAQVSLKLIKDKEEIDQAAWQHSCNLFNELATTIKEHATDYLAKANTLCDTIFTTNPANTHGAMCVGLFDQVRSPESEANAVVLTYTIGKAGLNSQAWEQVANIIKALAEKGDKTTYLEAKSAFLKIVQFGQNVEQTAPNEIQAASVEKTSVASCTPNATKAAPVEQAPALSAVASETEAPK